MILCWGVATFLLVNDEKNSYDTRFSLRGLKPISSDIVLVEVDEKLILPGFENRTGRATEIRDTAEFSDAFFWNQNLWLRLLKAITNSEAKRIGVTLFFGENLGPLDVTPDEARIFTDSKITWAATYSHSEKILLPTFTQIDQSNVGLLSLEKDEDGVIRKIYPARESETHFIQNFIGKSFPVNSSLKINFHTPTDSFPTYRARDLLNGSVEMSVLKDKYVLLVGDSQLIAPVQTPIGRMSRGELLAHIAENLLNGRWIQRFSWPYYSLFLITLILFAAFILNSFPQSISLVFIIWFATMCVALSAWVFDSLYIWVPAFSTVAGLGFTWFVLTGYQASRIEQRFFELQREQTAQHELEQLKNNFVSLISHDLKTPIAKIQSVVNRLRTDSRGEAVRKELEVLSHSGEELNKYIRSILSLLRVESQAFRIYPEIGDINELIGEAVEQLQPLAQEKDIEIVLNLEPMFTSEFDRTLIKEVIINLLDNAIKYSNHQSKVEIESFEANDQIKVNVIDHGRGIAGEDIEIVWDKFARGSGEDLRSRGSGLGLYLVKYFVELHGGQVTLTSELGRGTKIGFSLPLVFEEKMG